MLYVRYWTWQNRLWWNVELEWLKRVEWKIPRVCGYSMRFLGRLSCWWTLRDPPREVSNVTPPANTLTGLLSIVTYPRRLSSQKTGFGRISENWILHYIYLTCTTWILLNLSREIMEVTELFSVIPISHFVTKLYIYFELCITHIHIRHSTYRPWLRSCFSITTWHLYFKMIFGLLNIQHAVELCMRISEMITEIRDLC